MKKLLSLPPNLVGCFHDITCHPCEEWFCTNDPIDSKLGSGGGTAWLLQQAYEAWSKERGVGSEERGVAFDQWLGSEKRRSEQTTASLRTVGKDTDTHTCVPMGEGTATVARPAVVAGATL